MTAIIQTNLGKIELKAGFPINKAMQDEIRAAIERALQPESANADELVERLKKKDPTIGTPRGAVLAYMNARGWTQQALASKADISQPDISKMIRGKRPIGPESAKKLGKAFGVDYRKFL